MHEIQHLLEAALYADDLDRAESFYRDVLGLFLLRKEPGRHVFFRAGDAMHIPAGVWHAVANTGDDDVVMVFGFAHPDYPPTERR